MAAADRLVLRSSPRYLAARNGLILPCFALLAVGRGRFDETLGYIVLGAVIAAIWTLFDLVLIRTTVERGRIVGASALHRRRSARPCLLGEVEDLRVEDHWAGRAVLIDGPGPDGEPTTWRLDAPRALRAGPQDRFEADVTRLRQAWEAAREGTGVPGDGPDPDTGTT